MQRLWLLPLLPREGRRGAALFLYLPPSLNSTCLCRARLGLRRVDVIALSRLQDLLGRWSVLPVLAVACCVWNKWKATQLEGKLEQAKLEEVCCVPAGACEKKNRVGSLSPER